MQVISPTTKRICPGCGSGHISKSRLRGVVEQLVFRLVGVHPYRCSDCDKRFYGYSGKKVLLTGRVPSHTSH
jgi:hypothetical protein